MTTATPVSRWVENHAAFPEDRVSYNVLKGFETSPGSALYRKQHKKEATAAMEFGKAVDSLLFKPDAVGAVSIHPTSAPAKTNEFRAAKKEWLSANPRGTYLTLERGDAAWQCVAATESTPLWQTWMQGKGFEYDKHGVIEEPVGKKFQSVANVLDVLGMNSSKQLSHIADLKVVADVSFKGFRSLVDRLRWDIQAASYISMVEEIEGERLPFYWFCVQSTPPWTCAMYEMDQQWVNSSISTLNHWISQWFHWKNEEIVGETICANEGPELMVRPPWRN